jgi:hypothetical protein
VSCEAISAPDFEPTKNLSQPFVQVEYDQADVDDAYAGVGQLGHDPRQGAFAFGVAKLPFDGDAVQFILVVLFPFGLQLRLVMRGLFFRSTQSFARQADAFVLTVATVGAGPVNLIRMHRGGVVVEAVLISFYMSYQIDAFVISIPAELVQQDVTVFDMAQRQLGAELHFAPGLAANDGAHVWLADAHDSVLHAVRALLIHLELLGMELADGLEASTVVSAEQTHVASFFQQGIDVPEVALEVTQLLADGFADLFRARFLLLGHAEVLLAGFLAVGAGLLVFPNKGSVQLVDVAFGLLARFIQQLKVGGIGNVGRSAGRVY